MAPVLVAPPGSTLPNDWFYPNRKRCLACRKYFGFIVVKRLWCSYECAGMTPPSDNFRDWPREHRRAGGQPKATYLCPEDVDVRRHSKDTIHVYECGYCGMWHLGHANQAPDSVAP